MILHHKTFDTFHIPKDELNKMEGIHYVTYDSKCYHEENVEFLTNEKFKFEFIKKLELNKFVSNYEWKIYYIVVNNIDSPDEPKINTFGWRTLKFFIFKSYNFVMLSLNRKSQIHKMYIDILFKSNSFSEQLSEIFLSVFGLNTTKSD